MKNRVKFFLLICFLVFQGELFGQTKENTSMRSKYVNSLGFAAGAATGYGISYRYWPNKFGVQGTFAPNVEDESTEVSIGLSFLYKLAETEKTCFFLYQGNHYLYSNYEYPNAQSQDKFFNNGLGFGIELIILKRVSFNIMGGYAAFNNFTRLGFTGESALYFKF